MRQRQRSGERDIMMNQLRMFIAELLINLAITLAPDTDQGGRLAGLLVHYFLVRATEVDA
jgi:hypothetical protein